jgi:two-component system, NarL family, response regulator DesR
MSEERSRVIRVMIVEEMDLARGALAAVLESAEGIEVVAQLAGGEDVLTSAREYRPDVTVIDVARCDPEGLRIPSQLRRQQPGNEVLVLCGQRTPEGLRHLFDAGLRGFLDKEAPTDQLVESVRRLAAGDWVIDAVLAAATLHTGTDNPLTERQRDVLRLAGAGVPTAQIARQLYLSPGTVRNYLSAAIRKTGSRNLLEAVHYAERAGWL